jgi:Na+-driven multidrug efflux pump
VESSGTQHRQRLPINSIEVEPTPGTGRAAMLGAGGIGLNNSLHAATRAFGALSLSERQTMVANAHGVRLGRGSRETRGALGMPRAETATFLGGSLSETFIANVNLRSPHDGTGRCAGCRRWLRQCCAARQPVDDDASFGRLSMSDVGNSVSEWSLLLWLAAPLLIGKLADEISTVGMIRLWGGLGTQSLAAANLAWTWLSFTLVLIQGVQQALYSIVPQAAGAEKNRQVSTMLTASMLWTCVLLLPIAVGWLFLGEFIRYVEVGLEETNSNPNSTATTIDVDTIQSFSTASITWLLPFVAVTTLTNWLECLEIVSSVSAIAAVWTVARVALAWAIMHPMNAGLNGYAYGFAASCVGQLISLILVVFVWRKQHLEPQRWWFGLGCKEALCCVSPALNRRLLVLSAPLALQAALASWHTTIYNMLMAEFNAEQVAGYGVSDALTGAGGSISLALYTATSIRVGVLLGEGRAPKAKVAAYAGMAYALAFALICGAALYAHHHSTTQHDAPPHSPRAALCTAV